MDKDRDMREDDALNTLFAAADAARPAPSDRFLQSLVVDSEISVPPAAEPTATPVPKTGWAIGLKGILAASGLSGAAVLGMWIGFVVPDVLAPLATEDTTGLYTFLPGADLTAALSE